MSSTFLFALAVAAGPGFEARHEAAEPVSALRRFLEATVGACDGGGPGFDRRACEAEARAARRAREGKLFALELRDLKGRLTAPKWDPRRRAYRVLWTPVVGAGGLGWSVGRPLRADAAGRPVVKRVPLWVERPEGMPEFIFLRNVERGMVSLDVLFEIEAPWRLSRRAGQRAVRGLAVRLSGWRLRLRDRTLGEHVMQR